jgi:hypothetical protein
MKIRTGIAFYFLLISYGLSGQPFINEIRQFEKADAEHAPPSNPILFIGSSSLRIGRMYKIIFPDTPF